MNAALKAAWAYGCVTFSALAVIVDNPGLRQIATGRGMLAIERPNLVVIIDELEGRRPDPDAKRAPDDRRAYALTVTLAGRRLFDAALASRLQPPHETRMTAGADPRHDGRRDPGPDRAPWPRIERQWPGCLCRGSPMPTKYLQALTVEP